jgi:hypothetical protein
MLNRYKDEIVLEFRSHFRIMEPLKSAPFGFGSLLFRGLYFPGLDSIQKIFRRRHHLELSFERNPLFQVMPAGETIGQENVRLHLLGFLHPFPGNVSRKLWIKPADSTAGAAAEGFFMMMLHLDDVAFDVLKQSSCSVKGSEPSAEMAGIVISNRYRIALRGGEGKMLAEIREERSEGEVRGILPVIFKKGLKAGGTKKQDFSASGLLDLFDVIPKFLRVRA